MSKKTKVAVFCGVHFHHYDEDGDQCDSEFDETGKKNECPYCEAKVTKKNVIDIEDDEDVEGNYTKEFDCPKCECTWSETYEVKN